MVGVLTGRAMAGKVARRTCNVLQWLRRCPPPPRAAPRGWPLAAAAAVAAAAVQSGSHLLLQRREGRVQVVARHAAAAAEGPARVPRQQVADQLGAAAVQRHCYSIPRSEARCVDRAADRAAFGAGHVVGFPCPRACRRRPKVKPTTLRRSQVQQSSTMRCLAQHTTALCPPPPPPPPAEANSDPPTVGRAPCSIYT